jgi:hypothetical protein
MAELALPVFYVPGKTTFGKTTAGSSGSDSVVQARANN